MFFEINLAPPDQVATKKLRSTAEGSLETLPGWLSLVNFQAFTLRSLVSSSGRLPLESSLAIVCLHP